MRLNPIYQGIMCCALALPTAAAFAQQGSGGQVLEEIVVTGSLIRGIPEDAAMPVDTISADDLDKQGAPPPLEMLKGLSYMNGIVGESNNFASGRGQAAHGTASINMRGLGASRTLVLLNGKRVAASDANRLPTNAIARVEVLKDGGAVTYGSDAIGGVVNYITKESQDGFEFTTDYRAIDGSKGDYNIGLSWGTSTDRSDFFTSLNYYHRSELTVTDRDWAVRPYEKNPEGGWSTGANPGTFVINGQSFVDPGCLAAGGVLTGGKAAVDEPGDPGYVPADPYAGTNVANADGTTCRTQYTPWYNLVEKQDSYQFFTSYKVDLTDSTSLKLEALYASTEVPHATSAPSYMPINAVPGQAATGSPASIIPGGSFVIGANNPGLIDAYPGPIVDSRIALTQWRPFFSGGNPAFGGDGAWTEYERDQSRLSAELTGMITDNIGYRSSLSYSKSESTRQEWDIRSDKLQWALRGLGGEDCDPYTSTPGAGGCMWLNPFSSAYLSDDPTLANSPELAAWLMEQHSSTSENEIIEFNFVLDGEMDVDFGGGNIGWAAGIQYRHESLANDYDERSDRTLNPCALYGDTTCVGIPGLEGRNPWNFLGVYTPYDLSREVKAVFGELMIPVTDNLTAQLAARYEDYGNDGGDSFDPNLRLRWQATDWLAVRASAGTTFRVAPQTSLRPVPSTGFADVLGTNKAVSTVGNPDLEPEESTNYNIGVIFSGMNHSLSIDYWRFDIDKRLTSTPRSGVLAKVFPGGASGPNNCGLDPAFEERHFEFGAGGCGANNITQVKLMGINGSGMLNDGIDIAGRYTWDDVGAGYLTLGGSATWINRFETEELVIDGIQYEAGMDGVGKFNSGTSLMPLPEWRGNVFLDYSLDRQNIRWTMNYIDGYKDERTPDIFSHYRSGQQVSSFITHNLTYRLDVNEKVTINAVVDNMFDRDPPFVRAEMNYDPVTANPLGRTFKLGAKVRF